MKLTDAQFSALHTLAEFGPKELVEVHGPRGMDGKRKITVQGIMSAPTLAKLEQAHMISVRRDGAVRPVDAVGRPGHTRFPLTVEITDAGRAAIKSLERAGNNFTLSVDNRDCTRYIQIISNGQSAHRKEN